MVVGAHHEQVEPPPVRLAPRQRLDGALRRRPRPEERDADALGAAVVVEEQLRVDKAGEALHVIDRLRVVVGVDVVVVVVVLMVVGDGGVVC